MLICEVSFYSKVFGIPKYCLYVRYVCIQKCMLNFWYLVSQISIFLHGNVVLNLFLGRFSCRFPTSHECSSPAGSICWYTHLCLYQRNIECKIEMYEKATRILIILPIMFLYKITNLKSKNKFFKPSGLIKYYSEILKAATDLP